MKFAAALFLFALPLFAEPSPEAELKLPDGRNIRYVVDAPPAAPPASTADPARQFGLILCFPEHNRPTGDELLPVRESLRRQGLTGQYILLAGHPQAEKFGPADIVPIEHLIAWARQTYAINPRRIYMYGKGEGSKISAEFTAGHPDLVTASIGYSWGWWTMPSELDQPLDFAHAPEFYMVLGLRDLATHIVTVRDAYSRAHAKGYHIIYREFDDLAGRTYHPVSNDDALGWATRLRNKNLPLSTGEKALLGKPVLAGGFYPNLSLVGGSPAGVVVRKLLASGDPAIRTAAAETCNHAIFDEATVLALAPLLVDPTLKVRQAAIGALASNAGWRSAAAQKILIDFVANPAKALTPTDRASAVDALAFTIRFQIHGVRQDPPIFQALVALLADKDEDIRLMAANILAPIKDPDYKGDGGRPEAKTPPGGWQKWLDEIAAKNAGYMKDYEVCPGRQPAGQDPIDIYCQGGALLSRNPAQAFQKTQQAAEQGYVPAEAQLGMLYAIGKGTQLNYVEAGKWWTKAAAAGHPLAAANAARAPKPPVTK